MGVVTGLFLGAALWLTGAAGAAALQEVDEVPAICRSDPTDWAACVEAAEPGSPVQFLAYMNLGTQAFVAGDYESAAAYYDLSMAPRGRQTVSDAFLHAYRAYTFERVGRNEDAARDARQVWQWLQTPAPGYGYPDWTDEMRDHVLPYVLQIMVDQELDSAAAAVDMYLGLPVGNWIAAVNRVGVLINLDRLDEALPLSLDALSREPEDPTVTNNHCYLLTLMDRAGEALSYCERALVVEPNNATHLATHARTLAALGLCDQSEYQRAAGRALEPGFHTLAEPFPCTPASPEHAVP